MIIFHKEDVSGTLLKRDSCCVILISDHLIKAFWVVSNQRFNSILKNYVTITGVVKQ